METKTNSAAAAAAAALIPLAGAANCKLAVLFSVANKGSLPALARTKTLSIPIISFRSQPPGTAVASLHRHDRSIVKVQAASVQLGVKTAAVNTNQAWFPLHLPASPVHASVLPLLGDAEPTLRGPRRYPVPPLAFILPDVDSFGLRNAVRRPGIKRLPPSLCVPPYPEQGAFAALAHSSLE